MNWTPPAAARAAAARALEVRATLPRSQRAGTPVGIARAVALRDGRPISLDTARRMLAFFTRSARFESAPRPSKAWQAWNLWGGTPARDALERSPMLCLPCANPRAPVETAAAACMREIAHRSNPPKMPRTAQEARNALAAAYDDAVGRARVGAFRSDLSSTRAALDDAARYSYALGFYGAAPAVPYYLLDRMRAPADARQPDLFARSNPAPASSAYALARDFGAAAAKLDKSRPTKTQRTPRATAAFFREIMGALAGGIVGPDDVLILSYYPVGVSDVITTPQTYRDPELLAALEQLRAGAPSVMLSTGKRAQLASAGPAAILAPRPARSNPAPPPLPTVADLQAIKKREKDPIPVFTAWRGVLADYLAAEGYDVAHDPRGGGRTEWTDTGRIAHYIETTDDGDALLYVVDEYGPRAKIKTVHTAPGLIAVARAASKDSPRSMNARASEAREQHRAQLAATRENAPPPEPKRRPWATQPKSQPPRSLEAQADEARQYIAIYEQQAADARAAGNKTLEMLALDDVATYRADLAAVLADMQREEARQAAEDAAAALAAPPASLPYTPGLDARDVRDHFAQSLEHMDRKHDLKLSQATQQAHALAELAQMEAGNFIQQLPANPTEKQRAEAIDKIATARAASMRAWTLTDNEPAPSSPLADLVARAESARAAADAAAAAADAVKGRRLRQAARAAADAAGDEYAAALRDLDAMRASFDAPAPAAPRPTAAELLRQREAEAQAAEAEGVRERARRVQRTKPAKPAKPSKPSKPSKPAAPRRPVTGKAREVLARLGALGPVSLADVARVGCTDDTGARRIVAALIRAEAAAPSGPGAWMLDPARLDECPPQRPRTREPRPVCVGECGRWSPPKDAPVWIAALGPTSTIYDSEGRPYPVRWALARLDDLGDGWHASNVGGRADPKYDRELQARERGSSASRAQVEKIAGSLSLAQWVAPSSTPADSAPVVWIDPSARGHVVSGNGRTAAYALARPSRLAVAETVGGRWKIPKTLRAALEAADLVPVRIMGGPGEIDRAAAVLLAGASQASASGSLTQTERALSTVRALGLTVADMPALDWPEALTVARLVAFIAANRAWAAWATAPLAPERAILLSSDPLALTVHFRDVLIGLLPPEAREGGIGGLSIDRALVGALPGIWTLETRIRDGRAPAAWSLVAVLPEARSWAAKSAGRLKELAADAATDERQAGLFGPARLDTAGARLLAVALGGALARASGRTDPEAAGAEMVAALLAAAPDPSQPSLLGIDDADPVEVLARKARLSLPRANPPGRDLERLADAARRWHWGRYKRAKSARVNRATWQPSQGFALGELAAISIGADRLEVPPGHLLCATEEGDTADLFVVPPLPLGSLAPRPLRAIEYLADKAGDGPSWYVHDFDPAYPVAQTKGGALAIVRKGSRFFIDPERGIVG